MANHANGVLSSARPEPAVYLSLRPTPRYYSKAHSPCLPRFHKGVTGPEGPAITPYTRRGYSFQKIQKILASCGISHATMTMPLVTVCRFLTVRFWRPALLVVAVLRWTRLPFGLRLSNEQGKSEAATGRSTLTCSFRIGAVPVFSRMTGQRKPVAPPAIFHTEPSSV